MGSHLFLGGVVLSVSFNVSGPQFLGNVPFFKGLFKRLNQMVEVKGSLQTETTHYSDVLLFLPFRVVRRYLNSQSLPG